jgi:hypothetical protein
VSSSLFDSFKLGIFSAYQDNRIGYFGGVTRRHGRRATFEVTDLANLSFCHFGNFGNLTDDNLTLIWLSWMLPCYRSLVLKKCLDVDLKVAVEVL